MIRLNELQERLRRFSAARRGLLNAALGFRLGGIAAGSGAAGLLLLSGWLPDAFVNLALFLILAGSLLVLATLYAWKRARTPIGLPGETKRWPICDASSREKSEKRKLQRTIGIGPAMPTTRGWLTSFSGKSGMTRPGRKLARVAVLRAREQAVPWTTF